MLGKCRIKRCEEFGSYLRLFGVASEVHLTVRQLVLIEQLFHEEVNDVVHPYQRFIFKNVLYHGSAYKHPMKRNNCTIQITDGSILKIVYIIIIESSEFHERKPIIYGNVLEKSNEVLFKFGNISSDSYAIYCRNSRNSNYSIKNTFYHVQYFFYILFT